jgi:hypothetical protein
MIFQAFIILLLGWYCHQVVPQDYGQVKKPFFFLKQEYWKG